MIKLISLTLFFFGFLGASVLIAQDVTKVTGTVYEDATGEPMAFVSVFFKGTSVGTSTDLDGKFSIESRFVSDTLCTNFLGYTDECMIIKRGQRNLNLTFRMQDKGLQLNNVVILASKKKYSKKNNPAVDLMRRVIKNKGTNRLEGQDFYSFDQHEKLELDLNNITEEFKDRKIFGSFGLLWNYLDTSNVNGKIYLPMFLREVQSKVYYRKDPESRKEYQEGIRFTKFDDELDDKSISDVMEFMYQDIDIYDNTVRILDNNFISPISPLAIDFYRFYILDTTEINGMSSIHLGFIPKNKKNFGFTGDLYVSNDQAHRVTRADLGIIGDISLNFVNDLRVRQDFEPLPSGEFVLTEDELVVDYSITKNGIGVYGTRTVGYDNFKFDEAEDPAVYQAIEKVTIEKDAYDKPDEWWEGNRIVELTQNQEDLYYMIDTLTNLRAYKRLVTGVRVLSTGFVPLKKFDIGPLATFYSYNQVEGSRVKLGAETNLNFNKSILLEGYGAYGFRDHKWKYRGALTYSFNEDWKMNPRHFIKFTAQQDVTFPGQELTFIQNDNVLLSLRRGATNNMYLDREYLIDYTVESPGVAFDFGIGLRRRKPYGDLVLDYLDENNQTVTLEEIKTTTLDVAIEIAPNKQFIQGRQYRRPIINEYPIWTLRYRTSIDGLLGSEYGYHRAEFGFFKRFNMANLGHSIIALEGTKYWGTLPYTELLIPSANQSFAYQKEAFNMANFLEFVSDQQVYFRWEHYFKGFFFNRIPLFKKLELREIVTMKLVYGSLSDNNNPTNNPNLPLFDTVVDSETGEVRPLTYVFKGGHPYIEGSFGISNILKFLRLDIVRRFNYLDHPNVPSLFGSKGWGLRARLKVEF